MHIGSPTCTWVPPIHTLVPLWHQGAGEQNVIKGEEYLGKRKSVMIFFSYTWTLNKRSENMYLHYLQYKIHKHGHPLLTIKNIQHQGHRRILFMETHRQVSTRP